LKYKTQFLPPETGYFPAFQFGNILSIHQNTAARHLINGGNAVQQVKEFYKIDSKDLIVIFDDLDIPFGEVKYKQNGSGGTHNGMKNIVQMINTKEFPRIKIGIGNIKHEKQDLKDFVLEKFNKSQKDEINDIFEKAYEKLLLFLDN